MKTHLDDVKTSLHKPYSTDGIELDSILFEPKEPTKKIIIHIHGKEGHFIQNHFITHMGNTYPHYGYAFFTFNNRGHDYVADLIKKSSTGFSWQQGGSKFDVIEEFNFDIKGIINYVLDLGYKEIILQGHSLGPHKISYYLSTNNAPDIKKVIFLSTSDIHFMFQTTVPDWQAWSKKAKALVENGKGRESMPITLWSNCPVSANTFWDYTKPNSNFFVFNASLPKEEWKNFNKITLPILAINPSNDFSLGISAEKMNKLLKEKTASDFLETAIVNDAVHNFSGKEDELLSIITSWLTK